MAKKRLSEKDIDQLLGHYRAERRRLGYQLDLVRAAIDNLKQDRENALSGAAGKVAAPALADAAPRRRGRPRKDASAPVAKGKPGRPKKRERKERALNAWDQQVMQAITTTGRLLPKEEILTHVKAWAKREMPGLSASEVEAFLTRSLQKLSGKKKLLGTHHSGLRRGYHYGLKDWFFQSSGKLRKQHYDRLVLSTEQQKD